LQKLLWNNYQKDLLDIGNTNVIINLGDDTEGNQFKIFGRSVVSTDTDNQVAWATEILQHSIDVCKPSTFITLDGTPYHVDVGSGSSDFQVHNALKRSNPRVEFIYSKNLIIKIGGLVYSLAHVYPTTDYKTPPIEKLIKQNSEEYRFDNAERIDVFGRGHAHVFLWEQYRGGAYGFVAPCQQTGSEFGDRKPYLTVRHPDIGILKIHQEDGGLIPMPHIHHKLWE
jgi:hypothetical protein